MECIVVTGAGGFLGSHISGYFSDRGHKVYAIGRNSIRLLDSPLHSKLSGIFPMTLPNSSFIDLIHEFQPTVLIHCAGASSVSYSLTNPYKDFQESVGLTAFVLEALRKAAPKCKIIFPSSAAVYGNPKVLPISETASISPISPYGMHKWLSEKLIEEYSSFYDVPYTILRIFSAYGEGLNKQVVYDLCEKFMDTTTNYVEVYGTGSESRDFIHVIDICRAFEHMMQSDSCGIYNLASGKQTEIAELTEVIKQFFRSTKSIQYTGEKRLGYPLNWQADINKILISGFNPAMSLETGVKQYCDWFQQTQSKT